MVVLYVFLMIRLTFGMNPLKTKWLPHPFKKRWPPKKLVGMITYEPLMDCIQIWYVCSRGISNDLINFWDESIRNKWLSQPFEKRWLPKKLVGTITYEPLLELHTNLVRLFSR